MNKFLIVVLLIALSSSIQSQQIGSYKVAKVSFDDFKQLVQEVETIRAKNLISFDEFLAISQKKNVIILDARSREKYESKHIEGAINLPFTEFTQENLKEIIPHRYTTILIYCNNNFEGDPIDFASKMVAPVKNEQDLLTMKNAKKEISLALNVPTYINLYGYGYKNILELNELVNIFDQRLNLVGTAVHKRIDLD